MKAPLLRSALIMLVNNSGVSIETRNLPAEDHPTARSGDILGVVWAFPMGHTMVGDMFGTLTYTNPCNKLFGPMAIEMTYMPLGAGWRLGLICNPSRSYFARLQTFS